MARKTFFSVLLMLSGLVLISATIITQKTHYTTTETKNRDINFHDKLIYDKLWEKVDSLDKKKLPESALKVVEEIYHKAKEEGNSPQYIKSVIYKMKYLDWVQEEALVKMIKELESEANSAAFPASAVLHSITAEIYWTFYQNNRYLFMDRTETEAYKPNDIRTWDLRKVVAEVTNHYMQSLEKKDALKNIPIGDFQEILIYYKKSTAQRPTLFDFLGHRAADFFMNSETGLTKPAYKFQVDEQAYFTDNKAFAKLKIETKDTLSLEYHAMLILQELIAAHLNDDTPEALIDAGLERLHFVHNNSVHSGKDELYMQALKTLQKQHASHPASAEVSYKIANQHAQYANRYNPLISSEYKWDRKKAHEICSKAVDKFPGSFGATNCEKLINTIKKESIKFETESVNLPGKPFRALLSYKNLDTVYYRIIQSHHDALREIKRKFRSDELFGHLTGLDFMKSGSYQLENDGDFQEHSVEAKIPALQPGFYFILLSNKKDFNMDQSIVAYNHVQVSNISYVSRRSKDGSFDIFVMNRETGEPTPGVDVSAYKQIYNQSSREYELKKHASYTTNKEGYFQLPHLENKKRVYSNNLFLEFKKGDDVFYTDRSFYQYRYRQHEKKKHYKTHYFTDRKIYRPGQTVYFKGILLEEFEGKHNIVTKQGVEVAFYDANNQEVETLNLKTNDFGTFSGSFTAPETGVTGQMYIKDSYGSIRFSVEEYKRPKFEVNFNPVKGSYKLNEDITVNAKAKAYAGHNIDGADVKYRVVRKAKFPYWFYRYWAPYITSPKMEITSGLTKTDENGEFSIAFTAIPDLSVPKKYGPTFYYTVYADVTDINGETHSSETTIAVGYKALEIDLDIPGSINKNGKNSFDFATRNMNGQKEPAKGTITIHKLKEPDRLIRGRKWDRPDRFIITREQFYQLFPHDVYDDENNPMKWEKSKEIVSRNFVTPEDSSFTIEGLLGLGQGKYLVEVSTKDKFGQQVTEKKVFTVYDEQAKKIPSHEYFWYKNLVRTAEPGKTTEFLIGSEAKDARVLYEIEHKGKIVQQEWIKIGKRKNTISIPVKEEYRGNFSFHLFMIHDNRLYYENEVITVPYSNKKLDISFETFRNKLLPGEEEEWRVKIKGPGGDKVAAEMVATLYDASLDAFKANSWSFNIYKYSFTGRTWNTNSIFTLSDSRTHHFGFRYVSGATRNYNELNWFGFNHYIYPGYYRGARLGLRTSRARSDQALMVVEDEESVMLDKVAEEETNGEESQDRAETPPPAPGESQEEDKTSTEKLDEVKARINFNETAFFFPHLKTDEEGNVVISFTIPEALTRWKMLGFAHTKTLEYDLTTKELVTQKDLMVIPNAPRFFREGDQLSFSTKISNISDKELQGKAKLMLFDGLTMKPIDDACTNNEQVKAFTAGQGRSTSVNWDIEIPSDYQIITYRVVASAGDFSDGEEMALPVLSNRMMVTETLPLPINGNQTKTYTFDKLLHSDTSSTLKHHRLSLEFTSNPAWYAIQALPYLMEYPYECSEQIFSRYYANSIASHVANSNPKIKRVFDAWKNISPDALLSNLQKNQELKALLLEETPWVMNAQDESERKRRIGLLFDLNRMANELASAMNKLQTLQMSNGGWPWFEGMRDNRYITQHIITGFGHLEYLGVKNVRIDNKNLRMLEKGIKYLDRRIVKDYEWIKKHYQNSLDDDHLGHIQIHYLYARSYFKDIEINSSTKEAFEYYKRQSQKYWTEKNKYLQGMIALALHRYDDKDTPQDIIKSLKEHALHSEEMGMYWKQRNRGYYWYQAPIERQALFIEAFDEIANDTRSVEEMKTWLLKQKQTQDWETTKATVEACYALFLRGTDLLASDEKVDIQLGNKKIDPEKLDDVKVEAGTGYFKTSWSKAEIKPSMGKVKLTKNNDGIAWGALYWQYFENLDKITTHKTPLQLDKKLFIEKNTDRGPVLETITDQNPIKIGDKVIVRLELRVDRDMEYVHIKDMRAAGFEPINVLSQYKYQAGLGYYESTRDASTNFFISHLPKGAYVFEYPLFANNKGNFSNGITTMQCMYAPEFSSHSEGIRVRVEK